MSLDGMLSAQVTEHDEEGEKRKQKENMGKDRKMRGRERGKEGKKEGKKLMNLIIKDMLMVMPEFLYTAELT